MCHRTLRAGVTTTSLTSTRRNSAFRPSEEANHAAGAFRSRPVGSPVRGDTGRVAGGDMRRAKVIYLKLRLKQEFPTNYADAVSPAPAYSLFGKPSYSTTLDPSIAGQPYESSACLYAALRQSRRGMSAFNPDDIDPN